MTPPNQIEMQLFAAACGFLISGTFMRYVVKAPAKKSRNAAPDPRPRR